MRHFYEEILQPQPQQQQRPVATATAATATATRHLRLIYVNTLSTASNFEWSLRSAAELAKELLLPLDEAVIVSLPGQIESI